MAIAGIVAGGTGSRMGNTDVPKQFMDLCGKPVILYTVDTFLKCSEISEIIIGINPDWKEYMEKIAEKYFPDCKRLHITNGGADRNVTILNIIGYAKKELKFSEDEILVTHDAVRPFVTDKMIEESIFSIENIKENYDICTTAIPATDTVVVSENGIDVCDFPLRKNIFMEQTPQTFRIGVFEEVYKNTDEELRKNITDACKLFYNSKKKVKLIEGSPENIKLTYRNDFLAAESYLKNFIPFNI